MANKFHFGTLTHSPEKLDVISTCLGTGGTDLYTDTERGKAVKMGTAANHVLCVGGDEIEAIIDSIDAGGTENEGYSFGGVARHGRHLAVIGANQVGNAALLDLVVADDQAAVGTATLASATAPGTADPSKGVATVKTGTPTVHLWRIVHIYANGDGTAGTLVCIERAH